ncbi:MAG: hypothetical protein QM689_01595 [Oscillospiraceae bacterium]
MNFTFLQSVLLAILPAVFAAIITFLLQRRSYIGTNTKKIEDLIQKIGNSSDRSLQSMVGVNNDASLSRQHQNIEGEIKKSFGLILDRYDNEDKAYRSFSIQQRDLKQTLDNFSRDYFENIKNADLLQQKNSELATINEQLKVENTQLRKTIAHLKEQEAFRNDEKRYPFTQQAEGGDEFFQEIGDEDEFELI